MLGISVYLKDFDENYIRKAAGIGVEYVFTSLHIPEEDYSHVTEELPKLVQLCKEMNLVLCPDVSPVTFEKLGIKDQDFESLKKMGIQALRLDYGFNDILRIQQLTKDFLIMMNASVVNEEYIQHLQSHNIDLSKVIFTHNFYPKRYTGLSLEDFIQKSQIFQKYSLRVQAFVCGDDLKRFPMYEGLPTVEKHRNLHPLVATLELMKYGVTDVMIGDSKAKISTLEEIQTYLKENIVEIKVHFEESYEYLYNQVFEVRKDMSEVSIRLNTPRKKGIQVYHNGRRQRGSITIDNQLMGRYCGEIQLLKEDLPSDARVNVIGFIHPEYVEVLEYINPDTKIKFEKL